MDPVELKLEPDEESVPDPELEDDEEPEVPWLDEEVEPEPDVDVEPEPEAVPGLSAVNCCIHWRLLISKT